MKYTHYDNNSVWHRIGFRIGQFMATTVVGCLLALLIAVTVKIIMWMF